MGTGTGTGTGGSPQDAARASGAPFVRLPLVRDFLDGVPDRPVSVVVGPPGAGKTVAAAAWSRDHGELDLHWLGASGARAGDLPPVADRRIVVVDDAHLLDPELVAELGTWLTERPPTLHLLLLARREPTWLPAAMAVDGEVEALRFPELRLGPDEARRLVLLHGPDATDAQVEDVVARSEGWAAALVVGARALPAAGADPDRGDVVPPVLEQLLTEVLDALPASLRRVLACVAPAGAVTADQAVVMSGIPLAGQLLDDAAAEGLLVRRQRTSPEGCPTWRLHPLLVDVLRRRTTTDRAARQLVSDAHTRVAHHHARHGDAEEAVRHAARSGDLRLQVEMLRGFAPDLVSGGDIALVEEVLGHLPDGLRIASPELLALDALVLRALRRYDAAKRAADRALAAAHDRPSTSPDLEAELAILDVWQARCGWRPRQPALDRAAAVLGCYRRPDRGGDRPEHGHDTSGVSPLRSAWLMLDLADLELWTDEVSSAVEHLQAVDAFAQEAGAVRLSAGVLAHRAVAEMVRGAYQTSAETAAACLALQERAGLGVGTTTARCHLVRGWARFHALDLAGAAADLAAAAEGHQPFDPVAVTYRCLLEVNLLLAGGDLDGARRALDREGALPGALPRHARRHLGFARLRVAGYAGDLPGMVLEARALRRTGYDADADLAEALVRGLSGSQQVAVRDLDTLLTQTDLDDADSDLPRVTAAAAAVARVAILHLLGTPESTARAAALVPDVLGRVGPQRLWWLLATGSMVTPRFVDLVAAEAARPDPHPSAAEALAALQQRPRPYPERVAMAPVVPDPATTGLTSRELDVLRVLGSGGSNHDIAHELFVTENTVKTHLAAIYRKLDVPGREQAIREARRRGLLDLPPGPFRVTRPAGERA